MGVPLAQHMVGLCPAPSHGNVNELMHQHYHVASEGDPQQLAQQIFV